MIMDSSKNWRYETCRVEGKKKHFHCYLKHYYKTKIKNFNIYFFDYSL